MNPVNYACSILTNYGQSYFFPPIYCYFEATLESYNFICKYYKFIKYKKPFNDNHNTTVKYNLNIKYPVLTFP